MGKVVYRSKMFRIEKSSFALKGRKIVFDKIVGANTCHVIPVLKDGRLILEKQYRYAICKYLYEFPAGHIDNGENAEHAAIREVEEETGYRPRRIKLMFKAYPSPGSKTELMHYFVATDIIKTKLNREPDEIMTIKLVTLKKALDMVRKNQIQDLKSIAALLFYVKFIGK